jgi:hypothetical protein
MTLKFDIYTLADITQTSARKGQDPVSYKQQQNFLTVLQTIGLRVNPSVPNEPVISHNNPKFGSVYNKDNTVWKLSVEIEYADSHSVEMLKDDFNFVPIITGLTETAIFKDSVFITRDPKQYNVVFIKTDK